MRSRLATGVLALIGVSAFILVAGVGEARVPGSAANGGGLPPLTVTGNYSGGINGGLLLGTSSGTIDVSGLGVNDMTIDFTAVPSGYHPFAVACRKISHIGGNGAKDSLGTMNLWDLAGGNYTASTVYTWPSLPGDTIRSNATVTTSGTNMTYDVSYNGAYSGPLDLVALSNYRIQYRMLGQGTLEEIATGTVRRSGGGVLIVYTRTVYTGVENPLPFPTQSGTYQVNDYTFDGSHYHFNWNVTLAPGPIVPGMTGWGMAVVAALLGLLGVAATKRSWSHVART